MKAQNNQENQKQTYQTVELLARFGNNECYGLPARLLRDISVNEATELVDFLKPHLPELYVTLHHASNFQKHPRLRGWSSIPRIEELSDGGWNHPDWKLNKDIALFEAYIGKSREYWADNKEDVALADRIEEDYKKLFKRLLKPCKPEVFPVNMCSLEVSMRIKEKRYSELFAPVQRGSYPIRVDTLIYRIK